MDRRVTPPRRVTSPTWGPPPPCKHALKHTVVAKFIIWLVFVLNAAIFFQNYLISLRCSYTAIPLCVLISVFSYTWIFFTLRHHQTHVQTELHAQYDQHNQKIPHITPSNMSGYRKAVASALWLQLALVACYLPKAQWRLGLLVADKLHYRMKDASCASWCSMQIGFFFLFFAVFFLPPPLVNACFAKY